MWSPLSRATRWGLLWLVVILNFRVGSDFFLWTLGLYCTDEMHITDSTFRVGSTSRASFRVGSKFRASFRVGPIFLWTLGPTLARQLLKKFYCGDHFRVGSYKVPTSGWALKVSTSGWVGSNSIYIYASQVPTSGCLQASFRVPPSQLQGGSKPASGWV